MTQGRQATTSPAFNRAVTRNMLYLAIYEVLGYSQDELLGLSFQELKVLASNKVWKYIKRYHNM